MGSQKLNWRQARWALYLSGFDFLLKHVPGCYDLITQVATLGLRLEDELGVRRRECTID